MTVPPYLRHGATTFAPSGLSPYPRPPAFVAPWAPHGVVGNDSQDFPVLPKPLRRVTTLRRDRALSNVLGAMPSSAAYCSMTDAATSPVASSRRRKASALSIGFRLIGWTELGSQSIALDS